MLFSNISEEEFEFVREFELKGTIYKESESRIVVADVSVVLSTPMSKNTRKRRFFTPSTHIKNVFSSIITEDSSVLIVKPHTWT